jgi:hypothetical protein
MSDVKQRRLPEVPIDFGKNNAERQLLVELRQSVVDLRGPHAPPTAPTNFKVTPMAFGNLLQWTRGVAADGTHVFWNSTPSLARAVLIDVGLSHQYVDFVGNVGVKRYYWVQSYDSHIQFHGAVSVEVGPVAGTTLAAGTGVNVPTPPPPGQVQVTQSQTGQVSDRYQPGRGQRA